jgi:RNA polymerase I-specific transcription initiation factor RRN3
MTLIYSEPFIKEYYRYDSELIKDEGGSLNGSHIEEKHIP